MKFAHLIIVGGATPAEYQVKLPTVIGRGRAANLTIPGPLVSRLHCKLFSKNGRLAIRDLGSLNGTYVNNTRIDRETILAPGDVIGVGEVRLQTVTESSEVAEVLASHDTDQEMAPGQRTQTIQETTVAEFNPGMKTILGPANLDFDDEELGETVGGDNELDRLDSGHSAGRAPINRNAPKFRGTPPR